jgi:hypothetical protein
VTFDFSSSWTVDGGLLAVSYKERYSPDSSKRHHTSDDYVSEFAARAALHASGVGSKEFVPILPRRIPPSPRCSLWPTHATPFCQPCFLNDPRHTKVSRRNSRCYRLSASLFFSKPSFVGNGCAVLLRIFSIESVPSLCARHNTEFAIQFSICVSPDRPTRPTRFKFSSQRQFQRIRVRFVFRSIYSVVVQAYCGARGTIDKQFLGGAHRVLGS